MITPVLGFGCIVPPAIPIPGPCERLVIANHAADVVCLCAHPTLPLVATVDARGLLVLWLWPQCR